MYRHLRLLASDTVIDNSARWRVVELVALAQEHPGTDALLDDNHSHTRLVVITKVFEAFHELFDFIVTDCCHLAITDTVTEHNDSIRIGMVDLVEQ